MSRKSILSLSVLTLALALVATLPAVASPAKPASPAKAAACGTGSPSDLAFLGSLAAPGEAPVAAAISPLPTPSFILFCSDICSCTSSCFRNCYSDEGYLSNCGAYGICFGSIDCQ